VTARERTMPGRNLFSFGQGIQASSGTWYKNLQLLGTGGNAETYLVVATSGNFKGVPFAMKAFTKVWQEERRKSFLDEVAFLKGCNHPSIMRVYDDGVFAEEHPFLVAEYLPNTLERVIRADNSTTTEKVSFTLQLLSALAYLATLAPPIIHRDIKPRNIFVKGRSCVLGDFGLLKREGVAGDEGDREAFKESIGVGMPFRYRTPDLIAYLNDGVPPTTKSDVFQLGLVVAELFTGWNPLKRSQKVSDPVVLDELGNISGALSAGIANLISRMLILSPEQREPASKFIDPWQGVFLDSAKRAHGLEGRVF